MYTKKLFITLLLTFACVGASSASEVPGPGTQMLEEYRQGNITAARQSLQDELRDLLPEQSQPFQGETRMDAEAYLADRAIAANVVAAALDAELRHVRSAPVPDEVLNAVDRVWGMLVAAEREIAASAFGDQSRVQAKLKYAESQRAKMLVSAIILNRNIGRSDAVKRLITTHRAFLKGRGIPVQDLAPGHAPDTTPDAAVPANISSQENWSAAGPTLPITKLLLSYYEALAAEDEAALNQVLYSGEGYMNGAALLAAMEKEKDAEGDFDKILMPLFDNKTELFIQKTGPSLYRTRMSGVIKRVKLNDSTISQREADSFTVVQSEDNTYHIMILENADAE